MKSRRNANERELLLKAEVYAVVGCVVEVLKVRGAWIARKDLRELP